MINRVRYRIRLMVEAVRRVRPSTWVFVAVMLLSLLTFMSNRQAQDRFEKAEVSRQATLHGVNEALDEVRSQTAIIVAQGDVIRQLVVRNDCRKDAEIGFFVAVADLLDAAIATPDVPDEARTALEDSRDQLLALATTCPGEGQ